MEKFLETLALRAFIITTNQLLNGTVLTTRRDSMSTYIQLKQVARNRRFVIFTILFPIVWYWMMWN